MDRANWPTVHIYTDRDGRWQQVIIRTTIGTDIEIPMTDFDMASDAHGFATGKVTFNAHIKIQ